MRSFCIFVTFLSWISSGNCQFVIGPNKSPGELVSKYLINKGIRISNPKFTGSNQAIATFLSFLDVLPVQNGIVLSTGMVSHLEAPNLSGSTGVNLCMPGYKELSIIAGTSTFDAAILEFDFISSTDSICFEYFFGSEEYPEFVNKGVNDVFAFFLKDLTLKKTVNLAILPGTKTPVTVDQIHASKNSEYFIANYFWDYSNYDFFAAHPDAAELAQNLELDGITTCLTAASRVIPYHWYHIKLAIADAGDGIYDSGVFIKSRSFRSIGKRPKDDFEQNLKSGIENLQGITFEKIKKKIIVRANIEFEPDSFNVSESFMHYLEYMVSLFEEYPSLKVQIAGHTDNSGTVEYNDSLSLKRAIAISNYFIRKGIEDNRLKSNGFGQHKPLVPNTNVHNKAKNRRVEFIFAL